MIGFFTIAALLIAHVSAKAALSLNGDNAVVAFYPAFSVEEGDCFGTTCPNERVFNLFIDAPADGTPLCDWADAKVQNSNNAQVWSGVGGAPIDLNVDAFLGALFSGECIDTVAARASELVVVNGGAPVEPVQVNVIELGGAAAEVTAANVAERLAWRYPATCDADAADERIVVNVYVADWCSSGCFQTGQTGPAEC